MAQWNQIADRYRQHMQRVHTAVGSTSVAAAAASTSAASASVPAAGTGAESEIAETLTPKLPSLMKNLPRATRVLLSLIPGTFVQI